MSDTNCVVLCGRLTRDSEVKYANSGTAVCSYSLAVNKRKNGEEEAHFFDCVMFGKLAESLGQYMLKGKQVIIQGELDQNRWEDADGSKRSKVGVTVYKVQLLGGQKAEGDYV